MTFDVRYRFTVQAGSLEGLWQRAWDHAHALFGDTLSVRQFEGCEVSDEELQLGTGDAVLYEGTFWVKQSASSPEPWLKFDAPQAAAP